MPLDLRLNDHIETKKNHPCGNNKFIIKRTGIDFIIKCEKCEKEIWIPRVKLEKRIKKLIRNGESIKFK